MSIELYKDGMSRCERGHWCDVGLFEPHQVKRALEDGWRKTPAPSEKAQGETMQELLDKASNKDIRELAKEEGIEDSEKARIATLKKELIEKAENE